MKNLSAKYLVGALFAGLCVFAGCGEDAANVFPVAPTNVVSSSSAAQPQSGPAESSSSENVASNPASSSSVVDSGIPASSSDVIGLSSSSAGTALVNGPFTFATTPGALALAPDADGFYDMGDVYKAVPKTSKIAFVIRHSKRQKNNLGTESTLTPIGVQMAQTLGAKLVSDESFYYASTNFLRTRATCENIAAGRGETAEVVTWNDINGSYFLTVPSDTLDALVSNKGGNPKYIAQYSYGAPYSYANTVGVVISTYFYDLYERGNQFVNEVIVANMPSWKRVSILVSHDMLVEPLVAFVSNRTINLKVYESPFRWVNYLSGIAVIVDETGAVTALPVRGDEVGWMIPRDEVDEGV
ncbi:histidine phosphatase family protein [Fibrobacter sp. UWB2]|uniref:histidine phosphatase family protein n=1 Tax=Fibrobacter sp. UWB2 TaxID=1964358 RepID=UPI000B521F35|nr:histidine phosphatase family protein [Fibrobacter sp. UWB2]OWV21173.1 histidine phosphatase family protein [Fibrobacter sp. UWB2]